MSFLRPTNPIVQKPTVLGGAMAGSSRRLALHVQKQKETEWCWAAVSASIAAYYGSTIWSQCGVARAELGLACCDNPLPFGCNRPWSLDTALQTVGHFAQMLGYAASFTDVQGYINSDRPIGVRIVWGGGAGAHFIAIAGWLIDPNGTEFVDISDPWYGDSQFKYSDVVSAYKTSGDDWSHTYLTEKLGAVAGGTAVASSPISA